MTGTSREIPLVDVVQVSANNRQTCRIAVRGGAGDGELYLDRGELVHASCGPLRGEEAAFRLLGASDAGYRLEPGVCSDVRTIGGSWQYVLLEAARRADEEARARPWRTSAATGPHPTATLEPIEPPASRLPKAVEPLDATGPTRVLAPPPRRWPRVAAAAIAAVVAASAILAILGPRRHQRAPAPTPATAAALAPTTALTGDAARATVFEAAELTGAGDAAPVPIDAPAPRPPIASALAPAIACRVLVDEHGAVREAKIYRSRLELVLFEDAALDTVGRWRFQPARRGGRPVAAWLTVPITFAADDAPRTRVVVKGSDTIGGEHGVGPDLARAFDAAHPTIDVTWEGVGSSTAFVGLLEGSADLGASSRPISAKELAEAERLGVALGEHVLGYDGIAVIVHPDAPVRALTVDEVARVFRGEVTRWSELGGADRPLRRLSRPSYSGTHVFFRDKVLRGGDSKGTADFAADTTWIESTEAIAAAVAADPDAIGYVGLAWMTPSVHALAIAPSPGRPAIAATPATVRDGSYPIYRPLLLYVRQPPGGDAAALLRFALSPEGQALVAARGFVPSDMPIEALALAAPAAAGRSQAGALALRVTFGAGRAAIDDDARRALWTLATELRSAPRRVIVVGNADAEGEPGANHALARRRADAVAAYLRKAGVDRAAITVESAGADAPLAANGQAAGRVLNRRVDVLVAAPDGPTP